MSFLSLCALRSADYHREMRWMLVVDTCGAEGAVAVADLSLAEGKQVVSRRGLAGRETQERLMSAIAEVLRESGLSGPRELHALAVVSGPGSFTGVRVGMAAVKGLSEATGLPVIAISRLAMLAAMHRSEGNRQDLAHNDVTHAWLDAGRGDIYAGLYRQGVCLREQMLHQEDAFAAVGEGELVLVAENSLHTAFPSAMLLPMPGVQEAVRLADESRRLRLFADVALLDANYLRVPDAELARLSKQETVP